MGYVIKATYITGDSFHTKETSSELDPVWQDINVAEEALKWLNEHHKYYEVSERSDYRKEKNRDMSDLESKPWYKKDDSYWKDIWKFGVNLPYDNNTMTTSSIDYHGYFERLISLEITNEPDSENNDLKFTY